MMAMYWGMVWNSDISRMDTTAAPSVPRIRLPIFIRLSSAYGISIRKAVIGYQ